GNDNATVNALGNDLFMNDVMASDLYLRTSSRSSRGMAEPAAQRRRLVGIGSPGDIAVGPDQHGADTGEFAVVPGQLRVHRVQAVREAAGGALGCGRGGGGAGRTQGEQDESRGGQ